MFRLFQQLTIEQCLELMNTNYSAYLRKLLFAVIGSKLYWVDEYVSDYNTKNIFFYKYNIENNKIYLYHWPVEMVDERKPS